MKIDLLKFVISFVLLCASGVRLNKVWYQEKSDQMSVENSQHFRERTKSHIRKGSKKANEHPKLRIEMNSLESESLTLQNGDRISIMEASDCVEVLNKLEQEDPKSTELLWLIVNILERYCEVDPQGALAWMMASKEIHESMLIRVAPKLMRSLAPLDEDKAKSLIYRFGQGSGFNIMYKEFCLALLETDPERAINFAMDFPDDDLVKKNILDNVAFLYAEKDSKSAINFFENCDDKFLKKTILEGIVMSISANYPLEAIEFYNKQSWDGFSPDKNLINKVAEYWAERDPESMSKFVDGVSDVKDKMNFASLLGKNWSRLDPEMAAKWFTEKASQEFDRVDGDRNETLYLGSTIYLNSMSYGYGNLTSATPLSSIQNIELRDRISKNVARNIVASQPDVALRVAMDITDSEFREDSLAECLHYMNVVMKKDIESVVKSVGLSVEEQTRVKNIIKKLSQ